MKKRLRLAAAIVSLLWFGMANAQTRVIQGTVKDESGKSVPYMAVQVKGTTEGTYTDTAGKFSMAVDSNAKILVLNYPGMKSQEIAISDNMLITMKNDALGLSEVVITAIGIPIEKKALGYETQTVTSGDINTSGTSNMLNELEGKVAGLQVISSTGDPGGGTYINLRGPTALTGNNAPLMVIDGIPVDNSINDYSEPNSGIGTLANGSAGAVFGGVTPSNRGIDINPSDIESITVLKGPAATALYGITAANGALIITTKRGHGGGEGLGIDFNSSLTFSTYNQVEALQNQYAQGYMYSATDPYGFGASSAYYSGQGIDPNFGEPNPFSWGPKISNLSWDGNSTAYDSHGSIVEDTITTTNSNGTQNHGVKNPLAKIPVTAYNPLNFFQTGVAANNNISFSGGNDLSGFRMSAGNLSQTGIIPDSKYDKNTLSINGQTTLSKKLSVSGGLNYINSVTDKVQQGSNVSGVMLGLLRTPPTFDNSNGYANAANVPAAYILPNDSERDYRGGRGYDNPYFTVNENPFISTLNRVYGYGQLNYHLNSWITINERAGGDVYGQDDKNSFSTLSSTAYGTGGIYITDYFNRLLNNDVTVNANKNLTQDLNLNLTLGQNYFYSTNNIRWSSGQNLVLPYFLDMSNATSFLNTEAESSIKRSAWYGQAIIGFKSQLFLTLTGRDETTSTLSATEDNFFYPSADLGWVFTEALKMSTNKVFSYGKLRLSVASVGQDAPPQGLQTYLVPGKINDGFVTGEQFPFNGQGGYQISDLTTTLGNPNLKPQNTTTYEVGLDLNFFQGRLGLNATYYAEKTTQEIFTVPISLASGYAAELLNAGEVTNNGIELNLNASILHMKNGFNWDVSLNWAHNQNEVVSLAPGVTTLLVGEYQQYDIPGQSANYLYGQDFVRVPGTLYDPNNPMANLVIDNRPTVGGAQNPNYGLPIISPNETALAPTQPTWIGGITNTFSYKGISLGCVVSIREGGYMFDGTEGALNYFGTSEATANRGQSVVFSGAGGYLNNNNQIVHLNSAGQEVPGVAGTNTITTTYSEQYYQNVLTNFVGLSSAFIYSASYVRISQLSLAYDLPRKWIRKAHFTKVTIGVFATNPFLWTSYPGVDPESNTGGPANAQGGEYFSNPNTKSWGVRLNLGL